MELAYTQNTINEKNSGPLDFVHWLQDENLLRRDLACPLSSEHVNSGICPVRWRRRLLSLSDVCETGLNPDILILSTWWTLFHPRSNANDGCVYSTSVYSFHRETMEPQSPFRQRVFQCVPTNVDVWMDTLIDVGDLQFRGEPVEIDEARSDRVYDAEHETYIPIYWVVGIYGRETQQLWLRPHQDRSARSLTELIRSRVSVPSIVLTDEWKGYNYLARQGYDHHTVNHSNGEFSRESEDDDGNDLIVTTNNMEARFAQFRARLSNPTVNTLVRVKQVCSELMLESRKETLFDLYRL